MLKRWVLFIGVAISLLACLACSNGIDYSSNQNIDETELFSFSIKTSVSPNQVNIIELKEMGKNFEDKKDNEMKQTYHSFRIYYGEYGSPLEEYKEYEQFDLSTVDYFDIQWINDSLVSINVIRKKDDGSTLKAESIDLDISDRTYKKYLNVILINNSTNGRFDKTNNQNTMSLEMHFLARFLCAFLNQPLSIT